MSEPTKGDTVENEVKRITKETLKEFRACSNQTELFESTFPDGATINKENFDKAVNVGLDVVWLTRSLFEATSEEAFKKTDEWSSRERLALSAEYDAQTKEAWNEYRRNTKEARDRHTARLDDLHEKHNKKRMESGLEPFAKKNIAFLYTEYDAARSSLVQHNKEIEPMWDEYKAKIEPYSQKYYSALSLVDDEAERRHIDAARKFLFPS